MRDINRAERLLSLFTSPDSAAGIVGDLSEERGPRGSVWFWRQVLRTVLSLCRGAMFESPVVVLALVVVGFALAEAVSLGASVAAITLFGLQPSHGLQILLTLVRWPGTLIAGATLVAAAPRLGMTACVLLAGLLAVLSLAVAVVASDTSQFLWLAWVIGLVSPVCLLFGGAMIRRRWIGRMLRTAEQIVTSRI
jgi:hypothetical protein